MLWDPSKILWARFSNPLRGHLESPLQGCSQDHSRGHWFLTDWSRSTRLIKSYHWRDLNSHDRTNLSISLKQGEVRTACSALSWACPRLYFRLPELTSCLDSHRLTKRSQRQNSFKVRAKRMGRLREHIFFSLRANKSLVPERVQSWRGREFKHEGRRGQGSSERSAGCHFIKVYLAITTCVDFAGNYT